MKETAMSGLALAWFIPILLGLVVALVLTGPGSERPKTGSNDHEFLGGL